MQPTMKDILSKIQNTEVETEPFEYLVVDNLLPSGFYKRLSQELDADDFSNYEIDSYGRNKERYGVDITSQSDWIKSKHKIPTKIHWGNYNSLLSKKNINVQRFVHSLLKGEKELYSALASKLPTERIQDDYFFHISMIKDGLGYAIAPHTDSPQNIFTILFYVPKTDINKTLGLNVYKGKPLEVVSQIDFMPNRMIAFAPSSSTWHSVNELSDKLVGTRNSFQMFFYRNS